MNSTVAIIGSGPAALMAAFQLALRGVKVEVYEKKKGPARKLLIAGSSGLNITYDSPLENFANFYAEEGRPQIRSILEAFPPSDWINFIHNLGIETFKGSSKRYFVKNMKAAPLLRAWLKKLDSMDVKFFFEHECTDFQVENLVELSFSNGQKKTFNAVCFCLGGGSYEPNEKPLRWPEIFIQKGIRFHPFTAANSGFQVNWPPAFLKEAEGKVFKSIELFSKKGRRAGELIITKYGLEGTPVYAAGLEGTNFIDLIPNLDETSVLKKLSQGKENLSVLRRVKHKLALSEAAQALIFHLAPLESKNNLAKMASTIKRFPINFVARQNLDEAISSAGGICWHDLDHNLMLQKFPGVFVAGEMINWDAPTGGFLIQACVSQAYVAAHGIISNKTTASV